MINEKVFVRASKLIEHNFLKKNENNKFVCPYCFSNNIGTGLGRNKKGKILAIIISLLFWFPFGNLHKKTTCKDCGKEI